MNRLANAGRQIAYGMHLLAGAFLVVMMLVIMVDVVSRATFGASQGAIDFTFIGSVEIVSYLLLFTVFFSLPHSVSRSQVIVDLFTEQMAKRTKLFLEGIYTLGFGALGFAMAWKFIESAHRVFESGETTQDLQIPMYIIYSTVTLAALVLGFRGVSCGVDLIRRGEAV